MNEAKKGDKKMLKFHEDFSNTIGVEIELLSTLDREDVMDTLENNGVQVSRTRSYTHEVTDGWKVVTDSSLNPSQEDRRNGFDGLEIVSPILDKNLESLKTILDFLQEDSRFKVNVSCAVHVHFGAKDIELDVLKGAIKNYVKNETAIKHTLPNSRRDGAYNQSMTRGMKVSEVKSEVSRIFSKINKAENHEVLARSFRDHFQDVSMSSFFRQGTIEFRAHAGSLDFEKVNNWVVFLSRLFEAKTDLGKNITARYGTKWEGSQAETFKRAFFYNSGHDKDLLAWFRKRAQANNQLYLQENVWLSDQQGAS